MTRRLRQFRTCIVRLSVVLVLASGCASADEHVLVVSMRTDLVAAHEFQTASVTLIPTDGAGTTRRRRLVPSVGEFVDMGRLVELSDVESDDYRLEVSLLNADGVGLTVRPVLVSVREDTGVAVRISRDCLNVDCGDDMACLAGQCVDLRCSADSPEFCGETPTCLEGTSCTADAACAEAICDDGMCWRPAHPDSSANACDALSEWCHPESGCTPLGAAARAASCTDGEQNGGEFGVDCGGPCLRCEGQLSSVVSALCHNGVIDEGETRIDCGGVCTPCPEDEFCFVQTSVPIHECLALLALRKATLNPSWERSEGWLSNDDVCAWQGISCSDGHVTALVSPADVMIGTLPPEVGNLKRLVELRLREDLEGSIPPELGQLKQLTLLALGNNLSGTIPPELGDASSLDDLTLSDNNLSGSIPGTLGRLSELSQLALSNNELDGSLPSELGVLTDLRYMGLYGNRLEGPIPESYSGMQTLNIVDLSQNLLTGTIPAGFAAIASLDSVSLFSNQLEGEIPREFAEGDRIGGDFSISFNACLWHTACGELDTLIELYNTNYQATNQATDCVPPDNACR